MHLAPNYFSSLRHWHNILGRTDGLLFLVLSLLGPALRTGRSKALPLTALPLAQYIRLNGWSSVSCPELVGASPDDWAV